MLTSLQVILQVFLAAIVAYFVRKFQRWRNLPPGPYGIPFIGYSWFIPYHFEECIQGLFAKYGKVFTLNIYGTDVVMISDADLIRKCMVKEVFNNRPNDWFFTIIEKATLTSWNGDEWKEQRKFALKMFKQVGMGKEAVENIVHEEIEYLFAQITQEQESSTNGTANIEKLIGSSASNIVSLIVTGDRYDFDHPTRKMLDKMFLQRDDQELGRTLGVVNYLTWFVRFLISLPFGSQRQLINNFTEVKKYLRNRVKYCKESFDPEREEAVNFIQAYQKEMRHVSSRFFDDEHVYLCSMAFFGAGNATTKDFIGWCLQSLVVYTGIQEKMRTEIDVVVGKDRKISMKDKANLPYCEAFFAEVERMSSAVPLALIHEIAQDTQLDSYSLPKGTHFILNTFAIHYSPEYFPEPKIFKPERFLSKDGKKFVRDDNLMGFGTGKRSCPGEPLAKTEVFLYITTCIQKFMLIPSQDQVTLGGKIDSLSRVPKNGVQCIFQLRQ